MSVTYFPIAVKREFCTWPLCHTRAPNDTMVSLCLILIDDTLGYAVFFRGCRNDRIVNSSCWLFRFCRASCQWRFLLLRLGRAADFKEERKLENRLKRLIAMNRAKDLI